VLILLPQRERLKLPLRKFLPHNEKPTSLISRVGRLRFDSNRCNLSNLSPYACPQIALATAATGTGRDGVKFDHRNSFDMRPKPASHGGYP
jgi:hypothetical protein